MSDTEQTIKILAIESSCDETAAAVVVNGRDMRSNVISSQIALHTLYGGVVPEIASRKHIEKINQVIAQALSDADMTLQDMDAIGVTYGPGLVGALLVGVAEAKAISYAANIPLVGVHHIEGHISANYIENPDLKPPFLCLVVSGRRGLHSVDHGQRQGDDAGAAGAGEERHPQPEGPGDRYLRPVQCERTYPSEFRRKLWYHHYQYLRGGHLCHGPASAALKK